MYVEEDFVGPATLSLQAQRKNKNRVLKHWPTAMIGDTEVMDKLYLYRDGSVVDHPKLYNILGIKLEDLEKEEWKGIDKYYLYFDASVGEYVEIEPEHLNTYIEYHSPFVLKSSPDVEVEDRSEWFTAEVSYEPPQVDVLHSYLTNDEILNLVSSDPSVLTYDKEDSPLLTTLALLDTDESMFERRLTITYRHLTEVKHLYQVKVWGESAEYVSEVNLKFEFRRKAITDHDTHDSYLSRVLDHFRTAFDVFNPVTTTVFSIKIDSEIKQRSLETQLLANYQDLVPSQDPDLIMDNSLGTAILNGWKFTSGLKRSYIKGKARDGDNPATGLYSLKSRVFNKEIMGRVKTGHRKKKLHGWKKLVSVVVTVLMIVVAAYTNQWWILAVGSMAMTVMAIVLSKTDPAWSAMIGEMSIGLGYMSASIGIANMVKEMAVKVGGDGLKKAAIEAVKKKGLEVTAVNVATEMDSLAFSYLSTAAGELTIDSMKGMLTDFITSYMHTTASSMQGMLDFVTKAFQSYVKYVDPPTKGLAEKENRIKEQEKELEDLSSPNLKDRIDYTFSSPFYNIYDFNEVMQAVPFVMTQGMIQNTFNKYYDGTTSKVKYRGYLG